MLPRFFLLAHRERQIFIYTPASNFFLGAYWVKDQPPHNCSDFRYGDWFSYYWPNIFLKMLDLGEGSAPGVVVVSKVMVNRLDRWGSPIGYVAIPRHHLTFHREGGLALCPLLRPCSILSVLPLLIHASFANVIFLPPPKIQKPSSRITSLPARRLIHPHDARAPFVAFRNSPLAKYNPFKILTHNVSDSRMIRATILANKLILQVSSSFIPLFHVASL